MGSTPLASRVHASFVLPLLTGLLLVTALPRVTQGRMPADGDSLEGNRPAHGRDEPDPRDYARVRERRRLLAQLSHRMLEGRSPDERFRRRLRETTTSGTDRVLAILVQFGGPDTFTWTPGNSTWDPIGRADSSEYTGNQADLGFPAACNNIIEAYGLDSPTQFTYSGPLHNEIERPRSAEDESGAMPWVEDFNLEYYHELFFGAGAVLSYARQDGSLVHQDFSGKSVSHYFHDMSAGLYQVTGDVLGWVKLPHSIWWYGADPCPGARSGAYVSHHGGIPGAGTLDQMVIDALLAVRTDYPHLDWSRYDQDGDGILDRLWIVHAGLGEEDDKVLLNRSAYGEGGLWSSAGRLDPPYEIAPGLAAQSYTINPENCGIAVLAHEHSHTLGAVDLYDAVGQRSHPSPGTWAVMADNWIGSPLGFLPQAHDPVHLDNWGWLDPFLIADPEAIYTVTLGQASELPAGKDLRRAAKIMLLEGRTRHPVLPNGNYHWWGGREHLRNASMTLKKPISLSASPPTVPIPFPKNVDTKGPPPFEGPGGESRATLSFNTSYDVGTQWDFFWVQVSDDGGGTWHTLTNEHTSCEHAEGWIGGQFGFPADLCGAGMGGLTGTSPDFPAFTSMQFDLSAFLDKEILIRLWYMTDATVLWKGAYVDDIQVIVRDEVVFNDDAESGDGNWIYAEGWERNDGTAAFTHNYYLQWRNVSSTGGYDAALGMDDWRFGPANPGLLVWYNNNWYPDNNVRSYLFELPAFGAKGWTMLVDAHPQPYRDPYWINGGYHNEKANVSSRSLMRDAPFSLAESVDFVMAPPWVHEETAFGGRKAVAEFSDAQAYHPGAEYVPLGPGGKSYWITIDWDAGVVLPSTEPYGIDAPDYQADDPLIYYYAGKEKYPQENGTFYTVAPNGLGLDGDQGSPGEVGGHYGWNVRILAQTDATATVGIWNTRYSTPRVLQVQKAGDGTGIVRSNGLIACGTRCIAMYADGTELTLTAEPAVGSSFEGWSGACEGAGDCRVGLDRDLFVTAEFVPAGLPVPDGPYSWIYPAPPLPSIAEDPGSCMPIGLGDLSSGNMTIRVKLPLFRRKVDIYLGFYLEPLDPLNIYLLGPAGQLQPFSSGLLAWITGSLGDFEETIFQNIPLAALKPGVYTFLILVAPAGDTSLEHFYLWVTSVERKENPQQKNLKGSYLLGHRRIPPGQRQAQTHYP